MKKLGTKAIENRLKRYYDRHYRTSKMTDEWHINPAPNMWRFTHGRKTITLICDTETGAVEAIVK